MSAEMELKSEFALQRPHLADVGIISLVPDVWGSPWQPRHQILTRLSRYFNVIWCDPSRSWRELCRRHRPQPRRIDYGSATVPGLTIYQPSSWFPAIGRPAVLARMTMRARLYRAQHLLRSHGCRTTVLYLWRPWFSLALDVMPRALSCYHIDDEYTFSTVEKPIEEREAKLISRVDQVFIHSVALLEKKGKLNSQTTFVPNGVDYHAYVTPYAEPADLKSIPHPRMGYVGIVKNQLDFSLLVALAERHRQWSFVFVGPQHRNLAQQAALVQQLRQMPNVHFLGGKPVDTLPAYVQHMDVCMLCYAVNDYTKFIYPLKLHEYLASGRPVVGAPIHSLHEFAHIIRLAQTTEEWSAALNDMLAPAVHSSEQVEARRRIARQYDWNILVRCIARTLCSRLGPSYLERFGSLPPHSDAHPC
jgi:glycosyltransferase involved in cell wall biosynthesis